MVIGSYLGRTVTGVIKTTDNMRIYPPRVFRVRYVLNQSYYLGCDWERISKSSTRKVKGITSELE